MAQDFVNRHGDMVLKILLAECLKGSKAALRIYCERLLPPITSKDLPLPELEMPEDKMDDPAEVVKYALLAASRGQLSATEAETLAKLAASIGKRSLTVDGNLDTNVNQNLLIIPGRIKTSEEWEKFAKEHSEEMKPVIDARRRYYERMVLGFQVDKNLKAPTPIEEKTDETNQVKRS